MGNFVEKENGLFKFVGNENDIVKEIRDGLEVSDIFEEMRVCSYNSDYITFNVHRYTEEDCDSRFTDYIMNEDDIVYWDSYNEYLNFSNSFIVYVKVNNLESAELEFMELPKVVDNEYVHGNVSRHCNLFNLAITYTYTNLGQTLFHEAIAKMINPDNEQITYENHLNHINNLYEYEYNTIRELS